MCVFVYVCACVRACMHVHACESSCVYMLVLAAIIYCKKWEIINTLLIPILLSHTLYYIIQFTNFDFMTNFRKVITYLLCSDSKELQSWIDTINFVCASFSSQPLAGAVSSQRKFQRPLLPCSHTKLNLASSFIKHFYNILAMVYHI